MILLPDLRFSTIFGQHVRWRRMAVFNPSSYDSFGPGKDPLFPWEKYFTNPSLSTKVMSIGRVLNMEFISSGERMPASNWTYSLAVDGYSPCSCAFCSISTRTGCHFLCRLGQRIAEFAAGLFYFNPFIFA